MIRLGLKEKLLSFLGVSCVLILTMSILIGVFLIHEIQKSSALLYSENHTELQSQKLLTPISKEIALSKKFANSIVLLEWINDIDNEEKKQRLYKEVESFRQSFQNKSLYLTINEGLKYYYLYDETKFNLIKPYTLSREELSDQWYFKILKNRPDVDLTIDVDPKIQDSRIWINILVQNQGVVLGAVGTGLDVSLFLKEFLAPLDDGVSQMILNRNGEIRLHSDESLIQFDENGILIPEKILHEKIPSEAGKKRLDRLLQNAQNHPETVVSGTFQTVSDGEIIVSVSYIPLMNWHVISVINLDEAKLGGGNLFIPVFILVVALLTLLFVLFGFSVNRQVITPITNLQRFAKSIADGQYVERQEKFADDEIGELNRNLISMADQIQKNTHTLELTVERRTELLESTNRYLIETNKKLEDSIEYASLIQKAILPEKELFTLLGGQFNVLWQPKDRVGGDFYLFHEQGDTLLLGVVDCAGHGVPGALMTMLMRAAIDSSINQIGIEDPATLLSLIDQTVRTMMSDTQAAKRIAANADAGFIYVNPQENILRYAGAKMNLYGSDGDVVKEWVGGKRSLADRKKGEYENVELPLYGMAYYLTTDGLLDQAGGERNFGFGRSRFKRMILDKSNSLLDDQMRNITNELDQYRGNSSQTDDITLLSLKFDKSLISKVK